MLGDSLDISQDLVSLSQTPIVTVSSGAKSILDLPKTVEFLETLSVPVVGYKTSFFPAFYTRSSGIKIPNTVKTAKEVSLLFLDHLNLGLGSSLLVVNPISKKKEIPKKEIGVIINDSLYRAKKKNIKGKDLTPFLLKEIMQKTNGKSLSANISLAKKNINVGAKIAKQLYKYDNMSSKKFRNRFWFSYSWRIGYEKDQKYNVKESAFKPSYNIFLYVVFNDFFIFLNFKDCSSAVGGVSTNKVVL